MRSVRVTRVSDAFWHQEEDAFLLNKDARGRAPRSWEGTPKLGGVVTAHSRPATSATPVPPLPLGPISCPSSFPPALTLLGQLPPRFFSRERQSICQSQGPCHSPAPAGLTSKQPPLGAFCVLYAPYLAWCDPRGTHSRTTCQTNAAEPASLPLGGVQKEGPASVPDALARPQCRVGLRSAEVPGTVF